MTNSILGFVLVPCRKARIIHRRLMKALVRRPIILIPLIFPYLAATIFVAVLSNVLGKIGADALGFMFLDPARHPFLAYHLAKIFFCSAALVWLHYLVVAAQCFRAALDLKLGIFAVIQLVAVTVLIFAAAHYYVALFTNGPSSYGPNLQIPAPTKDGWTDADDFDDRLVFRPSAETVVDFIYFSAVTSATVGYGDMYPTTMAAKIVTMIQIITSFVLTVVVLAWVIGRAQSGRPPPETKANP